MSLKSVDIEIINRMFIEVGQAVKKSKEVQLKIYRERTIFILGTQWNKKLLNSTSELLI